MSPWERRQRGGLYYTRSHKVAGRVVREYVGTGPLAELVAKADAEERSRHEEEAAVWKEERERMEALEVPIEKLCEASEILAEPPSSPPATGNTTAGNGGRDVRDAMKDDLGGGALAKPDESSASGRTDMLEELKGLMRRVHEEGDEGALARLREILDAVPDLARRFLDPAEQAELSMIKSYAGDDLLAKEFLPRTLKAMRAELTEGDCSPLEHLLVERAVATWFQLQYFETLYAQNISNLTIQQSEFYQKRLDRAHRRHLSAIRTLAQVRKLLKGANVTQINIAEKQINTAGGS